MVDECNFAAFAPLAPLAKKLRPCFVQSPTTFDTEYHPFCHHHDVSHGFGLLYRGICDRVEMNANGCIEVELTGNYEESWLEGTL